jgi:hypothetical protein
VKAIFDEHNGVMLDIIPQDNGWVLRSEDFYYKVLTPNFPDRFIKVCVSMLVTNISTNALQALEKVNSRYTILYDDVSFWVADTVDPDLA